MKQETLEKFAENSWLFDNTMSFNDRISYVKGFVDGAKWQQERSYSEEEVYNILVEHTIELFKREPKTLDEWFKQFKKK